MNVRMFHQQPDGTHIIGNPLVIYPWQWVWWRMQAWLVQRWILKRGHSC